MTVYEKMEGVDWKQKIDDNFTAITAAELIELASDAETITGTDATKGVTPAGLQAKTSTATRIGLVELATDAEAITGTDTARALTPANLAAAATTHVAASSVTVAGKVELATDAEAVAVTDTARAITAHGLGAALASLDIISFQGKNGAGACTMTGIKAGDVVFSVTGTVAADVGDKGSLFESIITVNDQIQQSSASDLSTKVFTALVYRLT